MRTSKFKKLTLEEKAKWLQEFFNNRLKGHNVDLEVNIVGPGIQCEASSPEPKYDGMMINYEYGEFEVIETMAGKEENELDVFLENKSPKIAVNNFLKGNKRPLSKCLKIWKDF